MQFYQTVFNNISCHTKRLDKVYEMGQLLYFSQTELSFFCENEFAEDFILYFG